MQISFAEYQKMLWEVFNDGVKEGRNQILQDSPADPKQKRTQDIAEGKPWVPNG